MFEATGRRDNGRIEPRWFSIRHTESIRIDYSQLYAADIKPSQQQVLLRSVDESGAFCSHKEVNWSITTVQ